MLRKATYKLRVTRRESLHVHDEFDHQLMLVELEGTPLHYEVGVAGEFVSRRSVNFHDRQGGSGNMEGYAITNFQYGSVFSKFKGVLFMTTMLCAIGNHAFLGSASFEQAMILLGAGGMILAYLTLGRFYLKCKDLQVF